ncbi:conjugal transfer protein TraX [Paenibacillus soyae]|uniref:Conjugal transfer protein TraX n=1 Tax=Paenibacillus soyae TaxID=2969249 RepID=A0A9X2MX17_9BACL|nr:conjugal transfer protein TraX [Paenibacillus soyae]MCR2807929.1 conjugal transfer protein TraX [Paenibacillus soyae]
MRLMLSKPLTANVLKVIAIVAMFVDHASYWIVPKGTAPDLIVHFIGRLAAPIMCYLIAEGYRHTSNIRKYIFRLFLFAVVSHFPYVLFFELKWWQATSVMWGLLMGLVALTVSRLPNVPVVARLSAVLACCLFAWTADWNYIAVLWILVFGWFHGRFVWQMAGYAAIGGLFYLLPLTHLGSDCFYRFGILFAIPLFAMYNGTRGRKSGLIKWGFYVFYPVHLLVLHLLKFVIPD